MLRKVRKKDEKRKEEDSGRMGLLIPCPLPQPSPESLNPGETKQGMSGKTKSGSGKWLHDWTIGVVREWNQPKEAWVDYADMGTVNGGVNTRE